MFSVESLVTDSRTKESTDGTALVEFVSANPNSPITASSARGGVIGDVIGNILEALGCRVTREFYVNDALNTSQMRLFGRSLEVRYLQELGHETEMPEDGYQGDYVVKLAKRIVERDNEKHIHLPHDERLDLFTRLGEQEMLAIQKEDLAAFGIEFDNWFSERVLYRNGKVDSALELLKERDAAYESEGALWLRSASFGDELDRALVRDDGRPTYIASDTAYHADKFERGFNRLINVWGPQHVRYLARTKAAVAALGHDPERLDIVIHQPVQVYSGGQIVTLSSRRGEHILLKELVDEIGKDAARFFLLCRPSGEPIELDLELVILAAPENPFHSVRLALRRMDDILRQVGESADGAELSPKHTMEARLVNLCAGWPDVLSSAAKSLEPYIVWAFATQVASGFHSFYRECRVFSEDAAVTSARVALVKAARTTFLSALGVLGVSAEAQ